MRFLVTCRRDILISGFERGMYVYLRMTDLFLVVCSFSSSSSFFLLYLSTFFVLLIHFLALKEDFELDYKEDICRFSIIIIIYTISIK